MFGPSWPPSGRSPLKGRRPKSTFRGLLESLRSLWISPREIRAEAWALGGRHLGEIVLGAQIEGKARNLPFRRTILLKAVIRSQKLADRLRSEKAKP